MNAVAGKALTSNHFELFGLEPVFALNADSLDSLRKGLVEEKSKLEKQLGESIDAKNDYAGAAGLVRKLMFLDRLDSEIDLAYEALD